MNVIVKSEKVPSDKVESAALNIENQHEKYFVEYFY